MEKCWAEDPEERPEFSPIVKNLRKLMGYVIILKPGFRQIST